jgi:glycosyltransferase involved in cell wall biosynthesis
MPNTIHSDIADATLSPGATPWSSQPRISVVIPTLNEATNLELLLPLLPAWLDEVIVVDGQSTDGTVDVVRRLRPSARVIVEPRRGKGAALRTAYAAVTGDIIVTLDADGSMHPGEIVLLVGALMAGADFAKGSRFLQGGGTDDMSRFRMLGNWGLTQTVRLLYGGSFTDLCYGYFAFWSRHAAALKPDCDGFEVETFLTLKALKAGLKIFEVPSFEAPRIYGESHLRTIPDGWLVLRTILRERFVGWQGGRALVPPPPMTVLAAARPQGQIEGSGGSVNQ